ncbi:hypothetical protein NE865_06286 [Phthorimaea operculella]|nr:hypothetical protein NE865_06286 [Phthorimaea operculella]
MAGQDNKQTSGEGDVSENNVDPTEPEQNTDVNLTEEYVSLDNKLDELNTALDFLERKNDDIHERLRELLESNRSIREQLQNENNMEVEADQ